MMHREIFQKVAKRQAEGVMFHSEMTDYYNFLCIKDMKKLHCHQFKKEGKTFRKIKDYFTNTYHQTLRIEDINTPNIIPIDWDSKTSLDIDKNTLKVLLKNSLNTYMEWEDETCRIYKEAASMLFEEGCYNDYHFLQDIIDDVWLEKMRINDLMVLLQSVDYDISLIKGFQHKI